MRLLRVCGRPVVGAVVAIDELPPRPNLLVATGVALGKAVDDHGVHLLLDLALQQADVGALVRGLPPRVLLGLGLGLG